MNRKTIYLPERTDRNNSSEFTIKLFSIFCLFTGIIEILNQTLKTCFQKTNSNLKVNHSTSIKPRSFRLKELMENAE